jgi:ribonuclease PH
MEIPAREDGRPMSSIRPVYLELNYTEFAEGSVLISLGKTRVLCNASILNSVPQWMRTQGKTGGWVTAEYAMLPRATHQRTPRETLRPKARSQEIRRIIGRSLRAAIDLERLGELTCIVDCDVIQADGGTRTAAITGGFIALSLALMRQVEEGGLDPEVLKSNIAAISVGMLAGNPVVDLDYAEDSIADVDLNVVMNSEGKLVELQGSAEGKAYSREELTKMLDLAEGAILELIAIQKENLS